MSDEHGQQPSQKTGQENEMSAYIQSEGVEL